MQNTQLLKCQCLLEHRRAQLRCLLDEVIWLLDGSAQRADRQLADALRRGGLSRHTAAGWLWNNTL